MNDYQYTHRNGETTPPELAPDEFTYYWFDGIAHYENWTKTGELVLVTGSGTDRVVGLVIVAMMIDIRHPKRDATGGFLRDRAAMIPEPEHGGYDLAECEGKWWGPVHVPPLSDDMLPSMAAVEDNVIFEKYRQEVAERFQP